MELIQHVFGFCADSHGHFDLMDYMINYPVVHEFIYNTQSTIRIALIRILNWIN